MVAGGACSNQLSWAAQAWMCRLHRQRRMVEAAISQSRMFCALAVCRQEMDEAMKAEGLNGWRYRKHADVTGYVKVTPKGPSLPLRSDA